MAFRKFEKRKIKKEKRRMEDKKKVLESMSAQAAQLQSQLQGTVDRYAAAYVSLASAVAQKLYTEAEQSVSDAIAHGFEFAKEFERVQVQEINHFKQVAQVDKAMLDQFNQLQAIIGSLRAELSPPSVEETPAAIIEEAPQSVEVIELKPEMEAS